MTKNKPIYYATVFALLIIPILGMYFSYTYFNNKTEGTQQMLATLIEEELNGRVAGAQKQVIDITKEIPIIPHSEISSVDTSQEKISVTLVSDRTESEIESFYDDHFFVNEWRQSNANEYEKDGKKINLSITENIIQIDLMLNQQN